VSNSDLRVIDLRSDTLSLPTSEMLTAMAGARLGDDGRDTGGKGEDPTVNRLEAIAANLLGKEDALFVPSGTMGNMIALMVHAPAGSCIAVDKDAHVYKMERGNFIEGLHGYRPVFIPARQGFYDPDVLDKVLSCGHLSLVCIENTHNYAGGTVLSPEQTEIIADVCVRHEVPLHLDGARVFHAAAALDVNASDLVRRVDSVMVCLSKGLCAPVGSMLAGTRDFIRNARGKRRLLGGQMRQAGVLAAAGIVALEKMTLRVQDDNSLACMLAESLADVGCLDIDTGTVQTNMVRVALKTQLTAEQFASRLYDEYRVKVGPVSQDMLRMVIYNGIGKADIESAAERIRSFCRAL
jgi:threonine aldolase